MDALIIWSIIGALLGGVVGDNKGRLGLGIVLGLLLGLIGVLIVALLEPTAEHKQGQQLSKAREQQQLANMVGHAVSDRVTQEPRSVGVSERLADLRRLHMAGDITDEEFAEARSRVLSKI